MKCVCALPEAEYDNHMPVADWRHITSVCAAGKHFPSITARVLNGNPRDPQRVVPDSLFLCLFRCVQASECLRSATT